MAVSERSVEEILEIFDEHGIDLDDICKVIVHFYNFKIFDGTPIGKLRDAAKEILNSNSPFELKRKILEIWKEGRI